MNGRRLLGWILAAALLADFAALAAGHAVPAPRGLVLSAARPAAVSTQAPVYRLDLNLADEADWAALPGIGPDIARRIVLERQKNGPFYHLEDLLSVKGIGPKTLEKLRRYLLQP